MDKINYEIMLKSFKKHYSDYYSPNWSAEDIIKKDNLHKKINEPWTYWKIVKKLDLDTDIMIDVASLIKMLQLEYEFHGCTDMKLVSKSFRTGCSEWEMEYYIVSMDLETEIQATARAESYLTFLKDLSLETEKNIESKKEKLENELIKIQQELQRIKNE